MDGGQDRPTSCQTPLGLSGFQQNPERGAVTVTLLQLRDMFSCLEGSFRQFVGSSRSVRETDRETGRPASPELPQRGRPGPGRPRAVTVAQLGGRVRGTRRPGFGPGHPVASQLQPPPGVYLDLEIPWGERRKGRNVLREKRGREKLESGRGEGTRRSNSGGHGAWPRDRSQALAGALGLPPCTPGPGTGSQRALGLSLCVRAAGVDSIHRVPPLPGDCPGGRGLPSDVDGGP